MYKYMFTEPTIVEGENVDSYVESDVSIVQPFILQHGIIQHLDYTVHFPSTKLSSVNSPPNYDYNARNKTISRPGLSNNGSH